MLTLLAEQPECLWDDALPIEVKELPEDLAALDVLLADPELLWPFVERWRRGVPGDGPVGVDRGAADDRDGDLRAVDGAQAALPVGVSDVGGGGVGLDSSAAVLPDLAVRAGAGRVDGPQVDQADRGGDGGGDDARVDRQGAREKRFRPRAVRIDSTVIEADVKYPTDAGLASARGQGAGARGSQARQADRGEAGAGAGSLAVDGSQAAGDHPHDPPPLGGGEGGGAQADRRDRRAAGALDQGGAAARGGRQAQGAGRGARAKLKAAARWRRWRIAARRSPGRSASAWRASRSRIGSSRCTIRTPGRSARASWASPTSLGSFRSWRR